MKTKLLTAAIATTSLSLMLSACGTTPTNISSTPAGVTYTFDGSDSQLKDITGKAAVQCQKSGKIAVLRNVSKLDDSHVANFDCVDGSK